jgi:chromosome segregation ATPase
VFADHPLFPCRSELKTLEKRKRDRRKKREQREKQEQREQQERLQMMSTNPQAFMMMMQQQQQNGGQQQYNMPTPQQGHNPGYAPQPEPDQSGNPYASGGYGGGRR